jgi:hypothetical protein
MADIPTPQPPNMLALIDRKTATAPRMFTRLHRTRLERKSSFAHSRHRTGNPQHIRRSRQPANLRASASSGRVTKKRKSHRRQNTETSLITRSMALLSSEVNCPICRQPLRDPVVTPTSRVFCTRCILLQILHRPFARCIFLTKACTTETASSHYKAFRKRPNSPNPVNLLDGQILTSMKSSISIEMPRQRR